MAKRLKKKGKSKQAGLWGNGQHLDPQDLAFTHMRQPDDDTSSPTLNASVPEQQGVLDADRDRVQNDRPAAEGIGQTQPDRLAPEITTASARISALLDEIKVRPNVGGGAEGAKILARLLSLTDALEKPEFAYLVRSFEIAIGALRMDPPNLVLARNIRHCIYYRVRPTGPPSIVALGLGTLLYVGIPLLLFIGPRILSQKPFLGADTDRVLLVAFSGAIGSIVSIMVRLQDFSAMKNADPLVLFLTGLSKPVVGMAFALFIFAVLKAHLLPITVTQDQEPYFFSALAFISGFSERFARDIVARTERTVHGTESKTLTDRSN
jgi:hypothetical protein